MAKHPDASGLSSAQHLFGRSLRSFVVVHHCSFATERQDRANSLDQKCGPSTDVAPPQYSGHLLSRFQLGTRVDIQDPRTRRWCRRGVIVGIRQS